MEERRKQRLPREAQLWPGPRLHPGGRAPDPGRAEPQREHFYHLAFLSRRLPQRPGARQRCPHAPHELESGCSLRDGRRGLRWRALPPPAQRVHSALLPPRHRRRGHGPRAGPAQRWTESTQAPDAGRPAARVRHSSCGGDHRRRRCWCRGGDQERDREPDDECASGRRRLAGQDPSHSEAAAGTGTPAGRSAGTANHRTAVGEGGATGGGGGTASRPGHRELRFPSSSRKRKHRKASRRLQKLRRQGAKWQRRRRREEAPWRCWARELWRRQGPSERRREAWRLRAPVRRWRAPPGPSKEG